MNMYMVEGVPQRISELDRINIHGKVVVSKADQALMPDWKDLSPLMVSAQLLMNMFVDLESKADRLTFIPHTINIPGCTLELMELRGIMSSWGFHHMPAVVFNGRVRDMGAIEEGIESFEANGLVDYAYPYKGFVFRVLETQRRLELGYTSRYPEWAVKYIKGKQYA